jgi:oligopeptidase A
MNNFSNPLLHESRVPRFDAIRPEHVELGIKELLSQLGAKFEQLERDGKPTWLELIEPLERIDDELGYRWGIVSHLTSVSSNDALREAYERVEPDLVRFSMRIAQNRPVYDLMCALRDGSEWRRLNASQQRIVTLLIRDAKLAGVGLDGPNRERFRKIQTELAELSTRFSNNVLDATKAFGMTLRDRSEVDGLPMSALQLAAQAARLSGEPNATTESGPWHITLDNPSFGPFMQHSRRRELRERLYRAYIARASSGDFDNTPLITQILKLRQEMARLLEYPNYADLSLSTKMASGVQAVATLHEKLRVASFDRAHKEFQELKEFSRTHTGLQIETNTETMELQHWDVSFWAERLREDRYDFSEEELRPYFPLPRVLEGLFALAERLFGVRICSADGEVPVWHEDVRFFRVTEEDETPLAAFYLDPYSRPQEKRGGAWMDECTGRSRLFGDVTAGQRLPVAYLVCNQSPPVDGQPSLMRFREVETLFHEFGHGLQHMLTSVDYGFAAGINGVEHDAIELASQFMENWCYHRDTLLAMGCHYETNESLPTTFYDKICAARTFRAGEQMVHQLLFGLTDMMLHDGYDPDGDVTPFDVQRAVAETTSTLPLLADDRFLCSFSHIFAGGYAAGYYAYKWAEVLSADAFAMFEETGLEDPEAVATVGRRFRDTVLAMGGSRPAMDVFMAFRGREPDPAPLLRHSGLAD